MSLSIQGNSLIAFKRTLSDENIQRAINSSSKDEATHVGIWGKIKDWFCGTNRGKALEHLYELTHNNESLDTQSAFKKINCFYELSKMVSPCYEDKFQASVKKENGNYVFSFSITGVMDKQKLVYGKAENDILSIKNTELTNRGRLLDTDSVTGEGVIKALDKVDYIMNGRVYGIFSPNKDIYEFNKKELHLNLLNNLMKEKMAREPRIIQEWVSLQMKCFDYYNYSVQGNIDLNNVFETRGTPKAWFYEAYVYINEIKKETKANVIKLLSEEFNSKVSDLNYLKYITPKMVTN